MKIPRRTTRFLLTAAAVGCFGSSPAQAENGRRFEAPKSTKDVNGKRYYVQFRDSRAGAAMLAEVGAKVAVALPKLGAVAAYIPEAALEGLRRSKAILLVEEDPVRYPMAQTTPYGMTMVEALQIPDTAAGNTTVCIIDSGYYAAHEDLQSNNVTTSPNSGSGDVVTLLL